MKIDHARRSATFGIGELATFCPGPQAPGEGGFSARWRMELGAHWHRELRLATPSDAPGHEFEVAVRGTLAHRGWRLELDGRLDQRQRTLSGTLIREIKTTLRTVPRPAADLRAQQPAHFVQLGLYLLIAQLAEPTTHFSGELVLVEAATGLQQIVAYGTADETATLAHLDLVTDFLEDRRAALERLRALVWQPAFAQPRPGQETIVAELCAALTPGPGCEPLPPVVLAAPTGFGKTGVLLEAAFTALRAGRADRVVYLTGKSTGQLQVIATLQKMLAAPHPGAERPPLATHLQELETPPLSAWNLRPKREHCINDVYHCTRERCRFLADLPRRYREAGLARFHLFPADARDLSAVRAAGQAACVCPYEIARAALPACEVWLGDFNYLFSPANSRVFQDQPTWEPARTLLIVDEAHHLPARVAEAHSHALSADELHALLAELPDDTPRPTRRALEQLWSFVAARPATDALDLDAEDDLISALRSALTLLEKHPPDTAALPAPAADLLFRLPDLLAWLTEGSIEKLLWSPTPAALRFTCLDAAPVIGKQLREFGGVVLATATPPPPEVFAAALGLAASGLPPPTAAEISPPVPLLFLQPSAPWRAKAYDVALDLRVDTTFRRRDQHLATTVTALVDLRAASQEAPIVGFFPSYAYAEKVLARLAHEQPSLRCVLQPRAADLAAQNVWIDEQLVLSDILCFVLGGSFAEGIDHLGGRISHALVVGPALPEVNAVQRARQTALARSHGEAEAFRRTYLVPGLQKVNQALGRLVRAPGQRAKVVLHCRRFAEPAYASLLAPEYQLGQHVLESSDLDVWLNK